MKWFLPRATAALLSMVALPGAARSQPASSEVHWRSSTFCMYTVLFESHVLTGRCEAPLDAASEARYREMIAAVRRNFLENTAPEDKTGMAGRLDRYEAFLVENHRNDGSKLCHSSVDVRFIGLLRSLTSEKTSKLIQEHFASLKQDPFKGHCL